MGRRGLRYRLQRLEEAFPRAPRVKPRFKWIENRSAPKRAVPKAVRRFVEGELTRREPNVQSWTATWPPEEGTGLVLVWASEPRGLREVVLTPSMRELASAGAARERRVASPR